MAEYTKSGTLLITKKYRPLFEYLSMKSEKNIELSLAEIEGIIKAKLPKSATDSSYAERFFWNNNAIERRTWLEADYVIESFDAQQNLVRFKKEMSVPERPLGKAKKSKTIRLENPKFLECWFCKKDDIKFGATICSGCQSEIVYKTHSTAAEEEKVQFWVFFIGLLIGMTILVWITDKAFSIDLDEDAAMWWVGVPSVIGAITLTLWQQHKNSEDNIVTKTVEFKKPKAKGGFFIGTTSGDDD